MKKHTIEFATKADQAHEEMRRAFSMIAGKWKLEILWLLHQRVHRFGQLRKELKGITQNTLTNQLRELEADGLISRTVFAEVPPRVDYALTPAAFGLAPVMNALIGWWTKYKRESVHSKASLRRAGS